MADFSSMQGSASFHKINPALGQTLEAFYAFFALNVHILEKKPQLIIQQIDNMTVKSKTFEARRKELKETSILPWLGSDRRI